MGVLLGDQEVKKKPQHLINKEKLFETLDEWGMKYEKEYQFNPDRRWKFDVAFIDYKVAIEIEGGSFSGGRHTTGTGYQNDIHKYNDAQIRGWIVLRATTAMVKDEEFWSHIFDAIEQRGGITIDV